MATLQQHKEAMVDLLANGSAIPASASRLAHAMHDVLALLEERRSEPHSSFEYVYITRLGEKTEKLKVQRDIRVSEFIDGEIRDVKLAADVEVMRTSRECQDKVNAYDVWQDKTEWVQDEAHTRFKSINVWGMHRADVLREYLELLEAENERLKGYLNRGLVGIGEWQVVKGK